MSPGGLFAGTGPDGGDGPSRRPGGRKGPGFDTSVTTVGRRAVPHTASGSRTSVLPPSRRGPDAGWLSSCARIGRNRVVCSAPLRATHRGVDDGTTAERVPAAPRPGDRTAGPAARDRRRARVEGAAAPLGPLLPSDVLIPRELPGGAGPRVHRPLLAARRRGARSVLGPRDDAAAGRG